MHFLENYFFSAVVLQYRFFLRSLFVINDSWCFMKAQCSISLEMTKLSNEFEVAMDRPLLVFVCVSKCAMIISLEFQQTTAP